MRYKLERHSTLTTVNSFAIKSSLHFAIFAVVPGMCLSMPLYWMVFPQGLATNAVFLTNSANLIISQIAMTTIQINLCTYLVMVHDSAPKTLVVAAGAVKGLMDFFGGFWIPMGEAPVVYQPFFLISLNYWFFKLIVHTTMTGAELECTDVASCR